MLVKATKIVLQGIDSPRRDLEWRLYIASLLMKHGIASAIGYMRDIHQLHEYSKNCVWFGRLPGNTGRTAFDIATLESMKSNNTGLFFLHDEGAFYLRGEYESAVMRVYPAEIFQLDVCKKVFFWGEEQERFFVNKNISEKLVTSGAPRFDLAKPEYQFLDQDNVERLKDKYGKFILISGRFAAVNMSPDDPGFLSKRMYDIHIEGGALGFASRTDVLKKIYSDWSKTTIEFSRFVSMVANLALDYPNLNFVFRPHPSEKMSTYIEAFNHFPNVFVDKSFDIRPFIRASEAVIHCECTTGFEALIADRVSINFRPCNYYEEFSGAKVAGLDEVGLLAETYEDVSKAVNALLKDGVLKSTNHNSINSFVVNADNDIKASDVIVNEITKYFQCERNPSVILKTRSLKKLKLKSLALGIRYQLYKLKSKLKESSNNDTKKTVYPDDYIVNLWLNMGGSKEEISIVDGVIYTDPGKALK